MTVRIKSNSDLLYSLQFCLPSLFLLSVFCHSRAQSHTGPYLSWNVKGYPDNSKNICCGRDIRDYIIEIRKWNGLDSYNIIEGQLLQIPIYDESSRIDHTSSEVFGMNE